MNLLIFDVSGAVMYHTLTRLPSGEVLLIGGRGSPIKPNPHMYLLCKQAHEWTWNKIVPSVIPGKYYMDVHVYIVYVCVQ